MQTLVIYDNTGKIYYQATGDVQEPVGLKFIKVQIPEGKRIISVDTSKNPNVPVYEDIPKTDTDNLKETVANLTKQLADEKKAKLMLLEAMAETYEAVLPFLPEQ